MAIRVLVVGVYAAFQDGLVALIQAHPEMTVVGNVGKMDEVIAQVENLQPDVTILSTCAFNNGDFSHYRKILNHPSPSQILVLSTHETEEQIFAAIQGGVRGYLLKEDNGQEVINAILALSQGKTYFPHVVIDRFLDHYVENLEEQPADRLVACLSQRELEVLQLVVAGKTNAEISQILFLSQKTVETYRSRMMRKLGVSDLASLVKLAIREGLEDLWE